LKVSLTFLIHANVFSFEGKGGTGDLSAETNVNVFSILQIFRSTNTIDSNCKIKLNRQHSWCWHLFMLLVSCRISDWR